MRTIGTPSTQARKLNAIASGALPNGKSVIVNADGTVSVVDGVVGGLGSEAVIANVNSSEITATYDTNSNKVVVAYRDTTNNVGKAAVGTVSGTSISFGSVVQFSGGAVEHVNATFDSTNNKVVIVYQDDDNANYGTAVVGTVSGTSISFGTPVVFESAASIDTTAAFDSTNGKVVISYCDFNNSQAGTAIVGTVSGTSISFGSPTVYATTILYGGDHSSIVYDPTSGKVVVVYGDSSNSNYATANVGTVSGTSISFGSATAFDTTGSATWFGITYDSNAEKVVVGYSATSSTKGGCAVGTVSGTSISFGSPVYFESAGTNLVDCAYDASNNRIIIIYRQASNGDKGTYVVGQVSGTSISFDPKVVFNDASTGPNACTYDPDSQKVVFAYRDGGNSGYPTSAIFTVGSTTLTAENYIGLASNGYPDTAGATIDVQGAINDRQSGLTAGQAYYVQADGTLDTTPADPSVFAGTAISANKIIVKG